MHKILIVEDDTLAGEDLKYQLEHLGYQVPAIVPSAVKALKAVDEFQPDLVLMDIFLEGEVDGIQAAAQINERWEMPLVFMSIYSDKDVLERAKITQPFGYIVKPYTQRELHAVLSMALYQAEAEKRIRESDWVADTLDAMGAALLHTDNKGRVHAMNGFAEALLHTPIGDVRGAWLPDQLELRDDKGERPLAEYLDRVLSGQLSWVRIRNLTLVRENEGERSVDLTICSGPAGHANPGTDVLLQLNDVEPTQDKASLNSEQEPDKQAKNPSTQSSDSALRINAFIGTVSHDLRAPLGELGRFVQRIGTNLAPHSEDSLNEYADCTHQAVTQMQQLIQNLVIYMRLGRGRLALDRVSLEQALCESLEDLLLPAEDLQNYVKVDRPLPAVRAHAATLVRLLTQVLANSLQFVPAGVSPRIHVWAEAVNRKVRVCIEDNGTAIPSSQKDDVFGLFQTVCARPNEVTKCPWGESGEAKAGAGVGLAIVRRAAAWMNGRTGFEKNRNGGNRFWVELPAA